LRTRKKGKCTKNMCFNQPMSFTFAGIGLFAAWWIHTRTNNSELASGVFFFFTMEFLQGIQYWFIEEDERALVSPGACSVINQILTLVGFLHICLQPYFCHVINASLTKSPKYQLKYDVIKRLCLIGGFLLFMRFVLAYYNVESEIFMISNTSDASYPYGDKTGRSTEWLRGEKLCTYNGKYHLAWSIPMADASYFVPGAQIHSFLMYAPFFALYEKKGMIIQGAFLFFTGPVLAALITPNLMEQASIWCFFSIAQITSMLFLIREVLIIHWGKEKYRFSLMEGQEGKGSSSETPTRRSTRIKQK